MSSSTRLRTDTELGQWRSMCRELLGNDDIKEELACYLHVLVPCMSYLQVISRTHARNIGTVPIYMLVISWIPRRAQASVLPRAREWRRFKGLNAEDDLEMLPSRPDNLGLENLHKHQTATFVGELSTGRYAPLSRSNCWRCKVEGVSSRGPPISALLATGHWLKPQNPCRSYA